MITYIVIVASFGGLLYLFARYLQWCGEHFDDRHRLFQRFSQAHLTSTRPITAPARSKGAESAHSARCSAAMLGLTFAALGGILASSTLLLGKVG